MKIDKHMRLRAYVSTPSSTDNTQEPVTGFFCHSIKPREIKLKIKLKREKKEPKTAFRSSLQFLFPKLVFGIVMIKALFIGLRKVLEALVNLGNSEV